MRQSAFIGIDLGGTNVRAGAVTTSGELIHWRDMPIEAQQGPEAGLRRIIGLIEQVSTDANIQPAALGIGASGPIDRQRGAILNPYTLPTWEDVDIVSPLSKHFGCPVTLENDADAAALGEAWVGSGAGKFSKQSARLLMVTVGTGIGMGFILDGKIYRGTGDSHPEGGHIPLDPAGPLCYCGANGCWESLASGPAIERYAREMVSAGHPSSLLKKADNIPAQITATMLSAAAREGDPLSIQIVQRSATYLGLGLVNLMHIFLPDCVIFTGGVMHSFDLFEPTLHKVIKQHAIVSPLDQIPLRLAQLGQQAGIYGAARAAMLI
jgi:glucokinase